MTLPQRAHLALHLYPRLVYHRLDWHPHNPLRPLRGSVELDKEAGVEAPIGHRRRAVEATRQAVIESGGEGTDGLSVN